MWVLFGIFVGYSLFFLNTFFYNYDEGVYIYQSQMIWQGQWPYKDFFHHQPPFYLFSLAPLHFFSPTSLFTFRLLSLIAIALSGVVFYQICRRYLPIVPSQMALILYYFAPLQLHGKHALPIGLMVFLSILGCYLILFHSSRYKVFLGGMCLGLSILYKPLTLAVCLAVGITLILSKQQRSKIIPLVASLLFTGVLSWYLLHWMSEGQFTELIQLQMNRYASRGGFEIMRESYPPFREFLENHHIHSALEWNFRSHIAAFYSVDFRGSSGYAAINMNFYLLVIAFGGIWFAVKQKEGLLKDQKVFLLLWLGVPLLFGLLIWEPSWDNYYVVYLAPLSILGAFLLSYLWKHSRFKKISRGCVIFFLVTYVGLSVVWTTLLNQSQKSNFQQLMALKQTETTQLFTFTPMIHFISQTQPVCGLTDPFNTYGSEGLLSLRQQSVFVKYQTTSQDIIHCLESNPEMKIVIDHWSFYFLDEFLVNYIRQQKAGRVVFVTTNDRIRFERL